MSNPDIGEVLKAIQLVALDVDGVLTDGRVYFDTDGRESRAFNYLDIMGLSRWRRSGGKIALISGERNSIIDRFAQKLMIETTRQECKDKAAAIEEICAQYELPLSAACFIGDDVNDIPALRKVGLAIAVPNGWIGTRESADIVTEANGGFGAVREVIDMLMTAQEKEL